MHTAPGHTHCVSRGVPLHPLDTTVASQLLSDTTSHLCQHTSTSTKNQSRTASSMHACASVPAHKPVSNMMNWAALRTTSKSLPPHTTSAVLDKARKQKLQLQQALCFLHETLPHCSIADATGLVKWSAFPKSRPHENRHMRMWCQRQVQHTAPVQALSCC